MGSVLVNLASVFHSGGIWMWLIFATQMTTIAIMIERVYALYIKRSTTQKNLAKTFEADIKKGNIDRVIAKASSMGRSNPVALVAEVGAKVAQDMGGRDEIQLKIDEVVLEENSRLEKRTGFLATLGNVATLLGLLGTVVGLIESFTSLGNVDPAQKSALLASGISVAMHATAYGLITAVPALVMYAVLQNRTNALTEDLNKAAMKLFIWLSFNYESVTGTKKAAK